MRSHVPRLPFVLAVCLLQIQIPCVAALADADTPQIVPIPSGRTPVKPTSSEKPENSEKPQPVAPPAEVPTPMTVLDQHADLQRASGAPLEDRIQQLNAFLKDHPNSPLVDSAKQLLMRAHVERGEQALRSLQPAAAREAFQQTVDLIVPPVTAEKFRSFVLPLPVLMAGYGFRTEAVLFLRDLQEKIGADAESLEQAGLFYLSVEDPADAKRSFEKAIALDPKQSNLHYDLGVALQMSLRLDDAGAAFQKALELDPKSRTAPAAIGDLFRAGGSPKEAEKYYRMQLESVPDHATAWGGLALALIEQKRETEAVEAFARMLVYSPRDARFLTQIAYLYAAQGEFVKAARLIEKAKEILPSYPWAKLVEAHLKRRSGDFAEAENLLGEALDTAKFSTLYFELGKTLILQNDFDRAVEPFEAFLKVTPEGEFEAKLGGVIEARGPRLARLLAGERRAAILMDDPLTTDNQFEQVERFVKFAFRAREAVKNASEEKTEAETKPEASSAPSPSEAAEAPAARPRRVVKTPETPKSSAESWQLPKPSDTPLGRALAEFVGSKDTARAFRYLFAAKQLAEAGIELPQAEALARGALLFAAQAAEREDAAAVLPGATAQDRAKYLTLQAQTALGWVLYKEKKIDEAVTALRVAADGFDSGVEKRAAMWKLGVALETSGKTEDALTAYRAGYEGTSSSAAVQKAVIEALYQKVHGSLEGLELK